MSRRRTTSEPLDVRDDVDAIDFEEAMRPPGHPLCLTEAIRDWPALRRWTPEYFAAEHGDEIVTLTDCLLRPSCGVRVTMAEYIDYVREPAGSRLEALRVQRGLNDAFYAYGYKPFDASPRLKEDYALPVYAADWCAHLPQGMREGVYPNGQEWLLISGAGARSRIHRDGGATIAWFAQIYGEKLLILWPPTDEPYLYDGEVDPLHPDPKRYPLYAASHPIECRLKPGNLLFLPPDWHHFACTDAPSITISGNIVNHVNFGDYVRFAYEGLLPDFLSTVRTPTQLRMRARQAANHAGLSEEE